ncbi:hypothetical protein SALBM135S_03445 [Streptomyces alboniger]
MAAAAQPMAKGSRSARPPSAARSAPVGGRRPVPTSSASASENAPGNGAPTILSNSSRAAARLSADGQFGPRQVRDQVQVVQHPFDDVRPER